MCWRSVRALPVVGREEISTCDILPEFLKRQTPSADRKYNVKIIHILGCKLNVTIALQYECTLHICSVSSHV